jgi:hypothetical protein
MVNEVKDWDVFVTTLFVTQAVMLAWNELSTAIAICLPLLTFFTQNRTDPIPLVNQGDRTHVDPLTDEKNTAA